MNIEEIRDTISAARSTGGAITFWSSTPWSEAQIAKFEEVLSQIDGDYGGAGFRAFSREPQERTVTRDVVIGRRGQTILCGIDQGGELSGQVVIGQDSCRQLGMSFFPLGGRPTDL